MSKVVSDQDLHWLNCCIELAKMGEGFVSPNPMVGAVLVRPSQTSSVLLPPRRDQATSSLAGGGRADDLRSVILAEGWHARFGGDHAERACLSPSDPLSHAKPPPRRGRRESSPPVIRRGMALKWGDSIKVEPEDVLYVTLEPCCFMGKTPACTDIILAKGLRRVVVGMVDPDERSKGRGIELLRSKGVEVVCLPEDSELLVQLRWLNRFFICRQEKKRPWVTVKCAMSSDGYVSNEKLKMKNEKNGDGRCVARVTGVPARDHVYRERGKYDAIVVGAGTVREDDPELTTHGMHQHQPWRVVLGIPNAECRMLNDEFRERTIAVQTKDQRAKSKDGIFCQWDLDPYDIKGVVTRMYEEGWSSVYVEGGPKVWKSFLEAGMVDELNVYISPDEFGSGLKSGLIFDGFSIFEETSLGRDRFVCYRRVA